MNVNTLLLLLLHLIIVAPTHSRHTTAHSLLPCEYSAQRGDKNGPRTAYRIQKCGEKNFFRQLILILMAHKTGPSRTEWLVYNPKF